MRKSNKTLLTSFIGLSTLSVLAITAINFSSSVELSKQKNGPAIAATLTDDEVKHNVRFQSTYTPTDTYYTNQKSYSMSSVGDIESTWNTYKGKGTKIAVIDTGIDHDHPDFTDTSGVNHISDRSRYYYTSGSTVYYYSATSQSDGSSTYGWDKLQHDYDSDKSAYKYHGTNVAGSAAANDNAVGTVGIAPEATILALKTDMLLTSISQAINYAVSEGCDVINMSLGAYAESFTDGNGTAQTGYSSTATALSTAINNAYNNGVIVVAAAGNEKTSYHSYPASNAHVIGVGALAKNSTSSAASFSNYNKTTDTATGDHNVDIMAPGYVYAPSYNGSHTYVATQGTSFASPIVAGAAALWKQKNPSGTPDEFESDLTNNAIDMGETGWDTTYGYGYLDIAELLSVDHPVTSVSLNYGSTQSVYTNATLQFVATVYPTNASNKAVTWTSSDTSVGTVSSTGLFTPLKSGTTRVTVTTADGGYTDYTDVTVSEYVSSEFTASIEKTTMYVGDTQKINISWNNTSPTYTTLEYLSNDESVATVSSTGVITAVANGSTSIIVNSKDDIQEVPVTVSDDPAHEWVLCTSADYLTAGDKYVIANNSKGYVAGALSGSYLTAVSATFNGDNSDVITDLPSAAEIFTLDGSTGAWTLFMNNAAKYLTVSSTNFSSSTTAQKYSITYTSSSSNNVTIKASGSSYAVQFNASSPRFQPYSSSQTGIQLFVKEYTGEKTLTGIELSNQTTSYYVGDTFSFDGVVKATYSTGRTITVTPTSVSTPDMSTAGTKTVTVTYADDYGTATATYDIVVTAVTLTSISTSGQTSSYTVGDTFSYDGTCTATYNNGTTEIITPTVDSSAVDMSTPGTYTVKLTYQDKEISYTVSVNAVSEEETLDIDFTQSNTSATDSKGTVWKATGSTASGTYLSCKSSSTYIQNQTAIIVNTSKTISVSMYIRTYGGTTSSQYFTVTGYNSSGTAVTNALKLTPSGSTLAKQSGTLTFTDTSDNEITIKIAANVSSSSKYVGVSTISIVYTPGATTPKVRDFSISPATLALDLYNNITGTITPTITADEGADTTVTWSSNNEAVATVSDGTVTAVAVGTSTITAQCGSFSKTCAVTVTDSTPIKVTSITLDKDEASLVSGGTATLTATINPTNATDKTLKWTTTNSEIVSLSATTGDSITVTAKGTTGQTATVTATAQDGSDVSASCTITIIEGVKVTDVVLTLTEYTVPFGGTYDTTSISVYAYYSDGTNEEVTPDSANYEINTEILGEQTITATYQGVVGEATISVTNQGSSAYVDVADTSMTIDVSDIPASYSSSGSVSKGDYTFNVINVANGYTSGAMQWKSSSSGYIRNSTAISGLKSITIEAFSSKSMTLTLYSGTSLGSTTHSQSITKAGTYTITSGDTYFKLVATSTSYTGAITIAYSGSGESAATTSLEQAKAWAQYFLDVTSPICSGSDDHKTELNKVWTTLSNEYDWMIDASKDKFVDNETSDTTISDAQARYKIIIDNYNLNNFVTKSDKTLFYTNHINVVLYSNTTMIVLVVSSTLLLTFIAGYWFSKRKFIKK